jgi:hypothetical protein
MTMVRGETASVLSPAKGIFAYTYLRGRWAVAQRLTSRFIQE